MNVSLRRRPIGSLRSKYQGPDQMALELHREKKQAISDISGDVARRVKLLRTASATHKPEKDGGYTPLTNLDEHVMWQHVPKDLRPSDVFWDIKGMRIDKSVATAIHVILDELSGHSIANFPFSLEFQGYLRGHSIRTALYAAKIAETFNEQYINGKPELALNVVYVAAAALMHDPGKKEGKIYDIVRLPRQLDDLEFEEVKKHPEYGALVVTALTEDGTLRRIYNRLKSEIERQEGPQDFESFLDYLYDSTLGHHVNGTDRSYPDFLVREDISLISELVAVADAMDAMMSHRKYRNLNNEEGPAYCFNQLFKFMGLQFNKLFARIALASVLAGEGRRLRPVFANDGTGDILPNEAVG